ncbi:MAG: 5'/3'-nucleotidase SurE [Alphaproteobacteria bacterium]|nr:5'/3'-nucleotidase SurE [Alphaproteobacteria bacterium]MBU1574906.1 5'/3'-nucleotidase SurE [Alphaproteobacteria bacterium]MBU1829777.1 5'/3'-nucleotidase SurE [Alphaproteobacteria bacterium]MBU2078948.1 5'/3'-nucleotidase SurE [Alphaproteobacteria bacterium]MBU2160007.1 5'/3'-nucleotidase SurE [Alphaproteobacteria bacterium]
MRILITNDDGINAPGLKTLEAIAHTVAGPEGEVWVVAPAFEQSGVAHCISYSHPTMITELAPRRWAAEGSPADCVLAGLHDILPERPDLVLSGVNRGNNAGENVMYSGTIGGAMEAALQGVKAIALSQFFGPQNATLEDMFESAAMHGADVVNTLLTQAPWGEGADYTLFYNVNFPPLPASETKGIAICRQGRRKTPGFGIEGQVSPTGRRFLWVRGSEQSVDTGPGTDVAANLAGHISVTPMRADLTAHDMIKGLSALEKVL